MAVREFRLPDPGEGLTEAEIVTWQVAVGDTVAVNDVVVEVETAKSLVELPVPFAGTVTALLAAEGDTVEVGTPIITVDDGGGGPDDLVPDVSEASDASGAAEKETGAQGKAEGEAASATSAAGSGGRTPVLVGYGVRQTEAKRRPRRGATDAAPAVAAPDDSALSQDSAEPAVADEVSEPRTPEQVRVLAKPPVRKLAKDLGVDLATVAATGEGGVVTRADVEAAADGGHAQPTGPASEPAPAAYRPPASDGAREERIPVKGVRKMTAQAMVGSAFTAPHVTEWVAVDVTATMELVDRLKRDKEFADVKVTPLLVLAKAVLLAARRHPGVNATWDEAAQEIVVKHYVNLGIAAATPRGLLVPNVKDADRMTLLELAAAIGALAATAREGKTQPAEMSGGTITITNVGVFGVDGGTPIINPGESAILAFGAVRRMPWVVTAPDGSESIEPRWVSTLAMAFDHRLVDGELGSRYLSDVAAIMADPARALVWG